MLCLGGRLPDKQGAIITLDLSNAAAAPGGGAAADLTAWGEFHNGVAAGEAIFTCVYGAPGLPKTACQQRITHCATHRKAVCLIA